MLKERRFDLETQSWIEPEIFEGNALDYLQGIYQGRIEFDPHRFRAANAALAFESPKLAVAAVIHPDGDLAERLERAIARSNGGRLLTQAKTVEHEPTELAPARFIPRRRV